MTEKSQLVYDYIMQRCLWQFFSRNWDREENIVNIMADVAALQNNEPIDKSTSLKNAHYTDAKILHGQLRENFDVFDGLSTAQVNAICDEVRDKLLDITVTNSLNSERKEASY